MISTAYIALLARVRAFAHRQTLQRITGRLIQFGMLMLIPGLSGCLLTSPFWNQQLSSHTSAVPLQAFTTSASQTVTFQCAQAAHFGLYPSADSATWVNVANVAPSAQGSYDPLGTRIYSAGLSTALPASCWRQDPANSIWYAAIRATQPTTSGSTTHYQTFTKAGLECLGREIGKATSWVGWLNKNCVATYSGSSTAIPYVIVYSAS